MIRMFFSSAATRLTVIHAKSYWLNLCKHCWQTPSFALNRFDSSASSRLCIRSGMGVFVYLLVTKILSTLVISTRLLQTRHSSFSIPSIAWTGEKIRTKQRFNYTIQRDKRILFAESKTNSMRMRRNVIFWHLASLSFVSCYFSALSFTIFWRSLCGTETHQFWIFKRRCCLSKRVFGLFLIEIRIDNSFFSVKHNSGLLRLFRNNIICDLWYGACGSTTSTIFW